MRNVWNGTSQYSASIVASSFDSFSNFSVSLQKDEDEDARSRIIIACHVLLMLMLEWSRSLTMITVFVETVSVQCITICPERTLHNHQRDTRSSSFALPSTTSTTHTVFKIHFTARHLRMESIEIRVSQTKWDENEKDGWMDGWNVVDDQTSN